MAQILDGKALAAQVRAQLETRVAALKARGVTPGLAVILVGDDPGSQVYVRNKERMCQKLGFLSEVVHLPAETTQAELLARIAQYNGDARFHGILVQLPLPAHISEEAVLAAVAPEKDVDGISVNSLGALTRGGSGFLPCTPKGILRLLDSAGIPLRGKHAVVVGRSAIVGKPVALLLLGRDCTVTICHSKTQDLRAITRQADILVAAVGRPKLLDGSYIKEGAAVIDVGVNRLESGLCGDVDFESAAPVAGYITPVPGGVGPMTIIMLMENTVEAAEKTL